MTHVKGKLSESGLTDSELINHIFDLLKTHKIMSAREIVSELAKRGKHLSPAHVANTILSDYKWSTSQSRVHPDFRGYEIVKAYKDSSCAKYALRPEWSD
jgi:arginine repressor